MIIDKVNLHIALDLKEDLIECSKKIKSVDFKTILTANLGEEVEEFELEFSEIKSAFFGDKKALILQVNKEEKQVNKLSQMNHYYALCKNETDKYLLLFAMKKLNQLTGKTVIVTSNGITAYRLKLFLNRFQIKCYVISPDMAQQQQASIKHHFNIGNYDCVVAMVGVDAPLADNVVLFEAPEYEYYRPAADLVQSEMGSVLTLVSPTEDAAPLAKIQQKLIKRCHRKDVLRCLPILWSDVVKMKGRVETVLSTLSIKRVKQERVIEFKKAVVANKQLKDYFT